MPPTCYAGYRPLRFPRSWDRGADQTRQALGVRRTDTCGTRPRMVSTHGTASHAAVRADPDPVRPSPALAGETPPPPRNMTKPYRT
jgi:hypothetical protein